MAAQTLTVQLTAAQVAEIMALGYSGPQVRSHFEKVAKRAIAEEVWKEKQQQERDALRNKLQEQLAIHDGLWTENEPAGPPA